MDDVFSEVVEHSCEIAKLQSKYGKADRHAIFQVFCQKFNTQIVTINLNAMLNKHVVKLGRLPGDIARNIRNRNRQILMRAREDHDKYYLYARIGVIDIGDINWADKKNGKLLTVQNFLRRC